MFFVQNNPDIFVKIIITQPICIKWVEILKWQEEAPGNPFWDGCSLVVAIRVEAFPPPALLSLSLLQLCVWLRPISHRVWELYHWWTARSAHRLCEWHHWEPFRISESPCLSPSHPLTPPYSESRLPQGPSSYFFFPHLVLLSAFIRLMWHIKTPTWHSS